MFYSKNTLLAFAPINKKFVTLKLQDGFQNGDESPVTSGAESMGASTITLGVGTMGKTVPVGAHFTVAGDTTKYRVTARTVDAVGADEVQSMAASTATGGTYTITIGKPPGNSGNVTTAALAFDAAASVVETAIDTAFAAAGNDKYIDGVAFVAGDISVSGGPTDSAPVVFTFDGTTTSKKNFPLITVDGTNLTGGSEGAVTVTTGGEPAGSTETVDFTPTLVVATSGGEAMTFTGIETEVELGEGSNVTYDESREIEFFRSRGVMDEWREGDEQPMDVEFAFTWKFIKNIAGSSTPGIEEALKNEGNAADWTSASTQECAEYSVNVIFENKPNCTAAGELDERITFPEFIYTSISHDPDSGLITVTGQCNAAKAIVERIDLDGSSP